MWANNKNIKKIKFKNQWCIFFKFQVYWEIMSCNDWNSKGIKMFDSAGGYPVTSFDNHLGTIKADKRQ